jgi:hypothetical protein
VKIAALAPFPFIGLEFGGAERIQNLLTRVEHEIEVFTPIYTSAQKGKFANLNAKRGQGMLAVAFEQRGIQCGL